MATSTLPNRRPPFYRDTRVIAIVLQVLFVVLIVLVGWFLYSNMTTNLAATACTPKATTLPMITRFNRDARAPNSDWVNSRAPATFSR